MRDICLQAYKSFVTKLWHPDNHPSKRSQADQENLAAMNQAFKALSECRSKDEEARSTTPAVGYVESKDDSFFTKRNSFLSRTKNRTSSTRRRSQTPTPTTSKSHSRSRTNSSTNFPISPETSQATTPTSVSHSPAFASSPKGSGITTPVANSPTSPHEDPFSAPLNISSPTLIGSTLSRSRGRRNSSSPSSETDSFSSTFFSRSTSRIAGCSTPIVFSQSAERRKPPPIERKLECTLEELCSGCVKKIELTRDVITPSGIVQEEETLKIRIQAGWKKGTKIRFEGKGDEKPGFLPADIIFVIEEKRHSLFKRVAGNADDLEMGIEIPLVQALTGGSSISVPLLLGGENTNVSIDDQVIYPGYEHVIPGQGMLNCKQGKRGDLRIRFLVQFPMELSDEQRSQAHQILKDCCYS